LLDSSDGEKTNIEAKTMDGKLEDVRYKEDSHQLQLWIWTGLAILTILFAIQRMKK
jgi:hypothetical protein